MGSLLYRTQAYVVRALHEAVIEQIGPSTWEARSPSLGLTARGDSRDEAEYSLHTKLSVYVYGAHSSGLTLPAIAGIRPDDVEPSRRIDPESQDWFWTPEWQAGEREASEDIAAGRIETFDSAEDFLASFSS